MDTKKQINIAICVFCIMILICVIVFTQTRSKNVEDLLIDVYKYDEGTKTYYPCGVSTEDALTIKKEIQKAKLLKEKAEITEINGNYKIMYGKNDNDFVAFDNADDKVIFVRNLNNIYTFNSEIYNIVINTCKKGEET